MSDNDTILAIATPPGRSALAVIRISGPEAFEVVSACLKNAGRFRALAPRTVGLFTVTGTGGEAADEATIIKYAAPRSFTGENMVEVVCHGGPLIVQEIVASILNAGAKPAGRGAFTRRALENGKLDLLKAEAIRGMIESSSVAELLCSKKLYAGQNSRLEEWKKEILEISARLEAEIEFSDENKDIGAYSEGKKLLKIFIEGLAGEVEKRTKIEHATNGIRIVIGGPANAGKSTLFNMLLGYDRAIIHSEPGTTRDIISEKVVFMGNEAQLVDCAGIRDTELEIEKLGIVRSLNEIEGAGILIWVTAANQEMDEQEIEIIKKNKGKKILCIINKSDLAEGNEKETRFLSEKISTIRTSLLKQMGLPEIIDRITQKLKEISEKIELPDILLNKRLAETGKMLLREMEQAEQNWGRPEIASCHIKRGLSLLDELNGHTTSEEVLNTIFSTFCIGK